MERLGEPVGAYLVQVLSRLGYQATVRNVSQDQFAAAVQDPSRKIQLGLTGWAPDIPDASDFILPLLTCRSYYNLAAFCDHHVDQLASQAQAAQQADPAAARNLWASIDRIITDQAAWVPVFNKSLTAFFVSPGPETTRSPGTTSDRSSTRSGSGSARNFTTGLCDHALVLANPRG